MRIPEGGLLFGDFDEVNCFWIEKTDLYRRLSGKGFRSVEFVLSRPEKRELIFVEGRTTMPATANLNRFNEDISEISQKFIDSLHLTCGIWFGEHCSNVVVPQNRESFFMYGTQLVFVLVIKNRIGKLTSIAERIKRELAREHALLGFKVLVMNEELAIKDSLVVNVNKFC
jgi:hypothetical protein